VRLDTTLPLVLSALSTSGCGPVREPVPASEQPASISASAVPSRFDGFEGDSIAAFWLPGDYGSGRYAPGAVSISTEFARTGNRSAAITVREGDVEQRGDSGQRNERAELDSGKHPFGDRDFWYGFSFRIPPEFPVVDTRLVVAQWKQTKVSGGPLVAQRYRAGIHYLTIRDWSRAAGVRRTYRLPAIVHGAWNDMVYRIRPSVGDDGIVEVWMNGDPVVSHEGPTASTGGEPRIYNKIGLYRDRMAEPMTIHFDNYAMGDGFAAVDPSRFDRGDASVRR